MLNKTEARHQENQSTSLASGDNKINKLKNRIQLGSKKRQSTIEDLKDLLLRIGETEENTSIEEMIKITELGRGSSEEHLRFRDVLSDEELHLIVRFLPNICRLDVSGTQVSDIHALVELESLEMLYLRDNQVSDISVLAGLNKLESLDLSGTHVSDISALTELKKLSDLDLSGTQVNDISTLAGLKSLSGLDLSGTQVSNISTLAGLKNLTYLNISNTQVSAEEVQELQNSLPRCAIIESQ